MIEFVEDGKAGGPAIELSHAMRDSLSVILNSAHLLTLNQNDATAERLRQIVVRQAGRLTGLLDELDELLRVDTVGD